MDPLTCYSVEYESTDISLETGIVGASTVKLKLPKITDQEFPTVSIVVPTCNRKHFFELIVRNYESIDYPREKLELIILDDSSPPNLGNTFEHIKFARFISTTSKLTIGRKRNLLCEYAKHDYIVHMDDDDWYPPESVACRIRILLNREKMLNKLACFGCTKVLCLDLLSNQMFEAYDASIDDTPSTLSESTMAYSKKYWLAQKWDDKSEYAECLPFINGRHDTVCTGPSVFVITQFSHGNNTITRRVNRSAVSEYNSIRFQQSLSVYDGMIFNNVRANVIRKIPSYANAINFIQKTQNVELPKFKKEYKLLSPDVKANPLIIDLIRQKFVSKKTTSGRDIVYYCGPGTNINFGTPWNPKSKQLGGSEEAVINLAKHLVHYEYNVTVYCVLEGNSTSYDGVNYKPYYLWIPADLQDVTIIWRDPSNCKQVINSHKIFLDLHDAIDPKWLDGLDHKIQIMTKSKYHAKILGIKSSICIPNGITPIKPKEKIKNLMICTSSPDRCLRALLRALPLIREKVPNAEIHWAYGFRSGIHIGGMETNPLTKKWVEESKQLIANTPGFIDLGRLSQIEINELYAKASIFFYPTRFPEIDCISLSKAMSAGCLPICTSSGALAEKLGTKEQIARLSITGIDTSLEDGPEFRNLVEEAINALNYLVRPTSREYFTDGNSVPTLIETTTMFSEQYHWDIICREWIKKF